MKTTEQLTIKAYIEQHRLTQTEFARLAKVSVATVSNILAGNHDSISENLWKKCLNAAQTDRRAKGDSWRILASRSVKTVAEVCHDARETKRMLGIFGETGYGKTSALETYKRQYPRQTYYVLCNEELSKHAFLKLIASEMGLETAGTSLQVIERIVKKLNSGGLLILDDAGKLKDDCLRRIRLIYDQTVDQAGIILAGTTFLKKYLERGVHWDKMGFRELYRRIEYWQEIEKPEPAAVEAICKGHGIHTDEMIKYVQITAGANYGKLKSLIRNTLRLAKGKEITLELLQKVR